MNKRNILLSGLGALVIILCMITIYMQMEQNKTRISYNRADRELEMLKKDYDKLYRSYYSYEKKIAEILKFSDKVYWAIDSSAYVVGLKDKFIFSFFKKPVISQENYLWAEWTVIVLDEDSADGAYAKKEYMNLGRIDTLKPHEFVRAKTTERIEKVFVAPRQSVSENPPLPDEQKRICIISMTNKK